MNREMQNLLELLTRRPMPIVAVRATCDQILAGGRNTVVQAEACKLALVVLASINGPGDEIPWEWIRTQLRADAEAIAAERVNIDTEMHANHGAAWDEFRGPMR